MLAHPALPCGRHIQAKSGNLLCYRFSNRVFCHGTEFREILNDLCAGIRFDTHAPLIRKFCSTAIKLSNTARTMSATLRHVLENHHIWRVQFKQRVDADQATCIFVCTARIVDPPIDRSPRLVKKYIRKSLRLEMDRKYKVSPPAHSWRERFRSSARSIALSSSSICRLVFLDGLP